LVSTNLNCPDLPGNSGNEGEKIPFANKDVILASMRFGKNLFEKSRLESGLHPVGAWNRLKAGLQTRRTHSQLSFQTRSRRIVPGGVAILVLLFAPWAGYVHLAPATPLEAAAVPDIPMASLVPGQRIDAAIAVEPKKTGSSKSVRLFVKLRIAPGYHIYSLERSGKSSAPTSFEVNHRDGFSLSALRRHRRCRF
jgi:hypothetical protein